VSPCRPGIKAPPELATHPLSNLLPYLPFFSPLASRCCTVLFASHFPTGPWSSPLFSPAMQRNGRLSVASHSTSAGHSAVELTSPPPSDDYRRMSPSPAVVFNRAPPPLLSMTVSELLHAGHLEFLLRPVRLPILLPLCRVQHHAEFPPLHSYGQPTQHNARAKSREALVKIDNCY
jgi:hypothetical protein